VLRSDTKSDPLGIVLREYPGRVIAGMICFFAFFGIALGLGACIPDFSGVRTGLSRHSPDSRSIGRDLPFHQGGAQRNSMAGILE